MIEDLQLGKILSVIFVDLYGSLWIFVSEAPKLKDPVTAPAWGILTVGRR